MNYNKQAVIKNLMNDGFDPEMVKKFKSFKHGIIVYGGHFGDEGKGKIVARWAEIYKSNGLSVLSVRGQGSGNAGHTVMVDGKSFHFHYLTSAGLEADIMLLGAGMLIDPIRALEEIKQLPENKHDILVIDERATISCALDRAMDEWLENARKDVGKPVIGTTKSGVGPCTAWRAQRDHITFADAKCCNNAEELFSLFKKIPNVPSEVMDVLTLEYMKELFAAIQKLNVVNSEQVYEKCRYDKENEWAVLLEVSQAVALDPLFGNAGHFVTSTPTTNIGAVAFSGLTMNDFPDGSVMVLKAYASKVGAGDFITKFSDDESEVAQYIYDTVGEKGVTTGRKRNLGWFDGPAVRSAISRTNPTYICINCVDVLGQLPTDMLKICYAYKHKETGKITYNWPYDTSKYEPLFVNVPGGWQCYKENKEEELKNQDNLFKYLVALEKVIGARVQWIGTGGDNKDLVHLQTCTAIVV